MDEIERKSRTRQGPGPPEVSSYQCKEKYQVMSDCVDIKVDTITDKTVVSVLKRMSFLTTRSMQHLCKLH